MKRIFFVLAGLLCSSLLTVAADAADQAPAISREQRAVQIPVVKAATDLQARGRQRSAVKKRAAEMRRKQMDAAAANQGQEQAVRP